MSFPLPGITSWNFCVSAFEFRMLSDALFSDPSNQPPHTSFPLVENSRNLFIYIHIHIHIYLWGKGDHKKEGEWINERI